MSAKNTIKNYITPKKGLRIAAVVLTVLAVVSLVAGIMAMGSADAAAMEKMDAFYPSESEVGSMAYIDVVGISNWLYDYDGAVYYSAEDAEGYLYTVRISNSTYNKMKDQQEYWLRESDSEPMPEAYRLEGVVNTTMSSVKSSLADSWDITVAEYEQYFGTLYLNTTTAGTNKAAGWFVLALFSFIIGVSLLISTPIIDARAKKHLNHLEERGLLELAAQQLAEGEILTVGKNSARLSCQFLFGRGSGIVLPLDEILWCYQQTQRWYFIEVNATLVVKTSSGKTYTAASLGRKDNTGAIKNALVWIAQHNPNVMVGYTNENGAAYKQMIKTGIR